MVRTFCFNSKISRFFLLGMWFRISKLNKYWKYLRGVNFVSKHFNWNWFSAENSLHFSTRSCFLHLTKSHSRKAMLYSSFNCSDNSKSILVSVSCSKHVMSTMAVKKMNFFNIKGHKMCVVKTKSNLMKWWINVTKYNISHGLQSIFLNAISNHLQESSKFWIWFSVHSIWNNNSHKKLKIKNTWFNCSFFNLKWSHKFFGYSVICQNFLSAK